MKSYTEWEASVPRAITEDSLWKIVAYRLALFIGDVGWFDVTRLAQDKRTPGLADQLYRALGSISANLAEGYSRRPGKDRAKFYEYSLGSARESRDWYFKGRHILGEPVIQHRLELLAEIVRLLLTMVPQQRGYSLRETDTPYMLDFEENESDLDYDHLNELFNDSELKNLLNTIPYTPD